MVRNSFPRLARRFMANSGIINERRRAPVVAFVADPANANAGVLKKLISETPSFAQISWCIGNDVSTFSDFSALSDVDVLVASVFAGGNPKVVADLWPLCPNVKWVHSMAAGVDTLLPILNDIPGSLDVPLTNAKGAFSRSLAEYSLAAILHFNKQIPRLQANRTSKIYDRFIMNEIHEKTVGFIGFGSIAQTTARLCRGFGMRVLAYRNSGGTEGGLADEVFLASAPHGKREVFAKSDYVICSLPGGPRTLHACGRDEFSAMKKSGIFISIGRGCCVDETALATALKEGAIAGAALDVFETEPLPPNSVLWDCENLLLSPHNADLTPTYTQSAWDLFVDNFQTYISPDFSGFAQQVNKSKGY